MTPSLEQKTDEYYHVRFTDPDDFDTIRTPDWAERVGASLAEGSEVRTGHREGGDDSDWEVQSVLIPTDVASDEDEAIELGEKIVEKIND